jgi:hypothetical protein
MQNKVLNRLVYEICEIYIDDVLILGKSEAEFLRKGVCSTSEVAPQNSPRLTPVVLLVILFEDPDTQMVSLTSPSSQSYLLYINHIIRKVACDLRKVDTRDSGLLP